MGDRISFSFTNKIDKTESIAFFDHWGGADLLEIVNNYLSYLTDFLKNRTRRNSTPLSRLRPDTVMLDFIRWYFLTVCNKTSQAPIESDYYLGKDENDGDSSDNGHYRFELADYIINEKHKNPSEENAQKRADEMHNLVNELIYLPDGLLGFIKVKNESSEETKRLLDKLLILSINQKEVKL